MFQTRIFLEPIPQVVLDMQYSRTLSFEIFGVFSYHKAAGIFSSKNDVGFRFVIQAAVCTASDWRFLFSFEFNSRHRAFSRIVQFIRLATSFCCGVYRIVNSNYIFLLLNSDSKLELYFFTFKELLDLKRNILTTIIASETIYPCVKMSCRHIFEHFEVTQYFRFR